MDHRQWIMVYGLLSLNQYLRENLAMRWIKWAGVGAALLLVVSSFLTWVKITSRNIVISGMDTTGTNFGKPAYFHLLMSFLFIIFTFIPRVWAKRLNLFIVAMNFAWALRNYFAIPACEAGECPVKQPALYLVLLSSVIMLAAALFPDIKLPGDKKRR